MSNDAYYFQDLINRSRGGSDQAFRELVRHRICPQCGRTTLNTGSVVDPMLVACLACGWASPESVCLAMLPQSLLAHRKTLMADAERIRDLVRRSVLAGAQYEPGRLIISIHGTEETQISFTALKDALGTSEFERLQQRLPGRRRTNVLVRSHWPEPFPNYSSEGCGAPLIPFITTCPSPAPQADARQSLRIEM